jgi:DNA (cytosine-5)-methyltransferase 1
MNVLDLFSGIGGFSLGLERAGMRTVAFCEINQFCRKVLAKHWPGIPCYDDVRTLTAEKLRTDGISVDVICGGFPCQDISSAGLGVGITGERSGLWKEYARIVGEVRPRFVIVENVSALLSRGLDVVLGDLAALGFDAEWHCIPAAAVGAPHRRDRIWIIAYPSEGNDGIFEPQQGSRQESKSGSGSLSPIMGYSDLPSSYTHSSEGSPRATDCQSSGWPPEPNVDRVAHGVPARVDRLQSLGNAVVPQIPEIIGRAIVMQHGICTWCGSADKCGAGECGWHKPTGSMVTSPQ